MGECVRRAIIEQVRPATLKVPTNHRQPNSNDRNRPRPKSMNTMAWPWASASPSDEIRRWR